MRKFRFVLYVLLISLLFEMRTVSDTIQPLSEEIIRYTEEIGTSMGISPELLQAIIEKESNGKANAFNGTCIGLMQINPKYQKKRMAELGVTDLYDAYTNILVGADYLVTLFEKYEDPYLVLMCYNMGESKAVPLYESDKFSKYAISICERAYELEKLHDK